MGEALVDYVIGIDGGGTKTACVLADSSGNVLSVGFGRCSNHQICGMDAAVETISALVRDSAVEAGLRPSDIGLVMMGLAGADSEADLKGLYGGLARALPGMKIKIVNDIWIAFDSEVRKGWGAISICGTGHNAAVKTPDGRTVGIRALKYILGNYGGGRCLTDEAFHCAFRSSEHTGPFTALENRLPEYCGVPDMDRLAEAVYRSGYQFQYRYNVPKLVFRLAGDDAVCRRLVGHMGEELGAMLSGLIEKAGLCGRAVPVVLGGSLYVNDDGDCLLSSFSESLARKVPKFHLHLLKTPPVCGAVLMGFREAGAPLEERSEQKLRRALSEKLKKEWNDGNG